eukprot:651556-Rhodomonas_salina.4
MCIRDRLVALFSAAVSTRELAGLLFESVLESLVGFGPPPTISASSSSSSSSSSGSRKNDTTVSIVAAW